MNKINRAKLRGNPLEPYCKIANTTTHEFGIEDNRVYCYGLINGISDDIVECCKQCKAFVGNATPLRKCYETKIK